ncbi:hypothetical protein EV363DRAFT_1361526, partial [Boletus edulis]
TCRWFKSVLDLHLIRSGALPSHSPSLMIACTFPPRVISFLYLVDRLRMHAQRWACDYFPLLFTFTPCNLSSLEYLSINRNAVTFSLPIMPQLNLESAANLKSFMEDRIYLHWENLAELSFEFASHFGGKLCREHHLPCLQTLRVRRITRFALAHGMIDPLILPQLQLSKLMHPTSSIGINAGTTAISQASWHALGVAFSVFPSKTSISQTTSSCGCLSLSPALTSFRFIPCPRSQNISDVIRKRGYLDSITTMFRSRTGACARAAGVATLQRPLKSEDGLERVVNSLAQWMYENKSENGREGEDEHLLEKSVVVDSPYLPVYIDVQ